MSNKILSTLNIGNNSYEIDDAFARQKIEEVDNNLLKINPVYSTSGSIVSFNNGADNLPLDELIVDINPVQDLHGYDHPWIGGGGKNLFDKEKPLVEGKYISNDGSIQSMTGYQYSDYYTPVEANTSYIFSCTYFGSGYNTISFYDENKTFLGRLVPPTSQIGASFTTPQDCAYIRFNMGRETILSTLQLEKGSVATDYVPYENICPITGWTGINVRHTGANIWDEEWELGSLDNTTGEKTVSTASIRSKNFIPVFPNTQYYFPNMDGYVLQYDKNKQYIDLLRDRNTTPTDPNCYFLMFRLSTNYGMEYKNDYSINYPATIMEYEPYNGMVIPISWESEAGTVYGGNLDVLTGVLTVTHGFIDCGHTAQTGWVKYDTHNGFYLKSSVTGMAQNEWFSDEWTKCNLFKKINSWSQGVGVRFGLSNSNNIFFNEVQTDYPSLEAWMEFIQSNNLQLSYPLETPIIYQLTPHEIKTFLDQNNIFTNINSKNILVSYKADVQKCIDNKLNVAETAYKATSIPYGQVDATSTSTNFTATIDGVTELRDGVCIILKNGVITSASGFTININNLGAKPVYNSMTASTRETNIFNVAYTIMLIYNTSLNNGDGGWWFYRGYNSDNNSIGYTLRTNSMSLPVSSHTHRYRLLFTSADGTHFVPANNDTTDNTTAIKNVCQEKIDPFGTIRYYNGSSNLEAEGVPSGSTMWEQNTFSLGYSFNHVGGAINLAIRKPVYVKALPQSDGSAIINADEAYVQDLPITEDGYIYIYLGVAYSASNMELTSYHPVYYCYNGVIKPWLGFTDSEHAQDIVSSVNGKTGTVTLTAEDVGAMEGMTILSYGHSTWAEFLEAYEANRIVYCKASIDSDPSTGQQGRMAFLAYVQYQRQGYSDKAEFQYYRSVSTHTDAQQGDQVFCYSLSPINGGTWSVETRQASSRVVAGTGLSSAYTTNKVTLSLDTDYKSKIDTLWTDYQSALIALDGGE